MNAARRTPERVAVIARARAWRDGRDRRLWSTEDVARYLGVDLARALAILCASKIVTPTDAEVAALDQLFSVA